MDGVGRNLGTVSEGEEDDEYYDSEASEEDDKGDGGIRRGEPNKFDSICDGVLNTLALVHASLNELLEVKDELIKHQLPPNVLTKVSLTTTKAFRSIGDMHMPINELIRLVHIYSTPWEEKSAALKKLHEDYEAKKSQLNIAIKRLQLVDGQSRRMNKEKRIMNWEKLFCRATAAKGHGRRWKFLIDAFKQKAKEGIPSLQHYLDDLENASDSEDELEPDMDYPIDTQMQHLLETPENLDSESEKKTEQDVDKETTTEKASNDKKKDTESEIESTVDEMESQMTTKDTDMESDVTIQKDLPTFFKPPMRDQEISTNDPNFQRYLYVKVFKPEGLDHRELKCSFICGKERYKTDLLDPLPEDDLDDITSPIDQKEDAPKDSDTSNKPDSKPSLVKKRVSLIGTRQSKGSANSSTKQTSSPSPEESKTSKLSRYEEMIFSLPEKSLLKMSKSQSTVSMPEHLKVSVHYGPKDEMVAMATIDMADLDSLELPSVILPPPSDSADVIHPEDLRAIMDSDMDFTDDESIKGTLKSESLHSDFDSKFNLPKHYRDIEPINFPLYSIHGGNSGAVHSPCGQLPLVCLWAKKLVPRKFHKETEADSLTDIVLDMTGIDLREITKEELHKETVERCISAMSVISEPKEETVSRADYDRLMKTHREEMEVLQDEYEQRLQDLAESIHQMQSMHYDTTPVRPSSRATSSGRPRSTSSRESPQSYHDNHIPRPPSEIRVVTGEQPTKSRKKLGKSLPQWGENLPKDFLERLRWFEDMSNKHKQELSEKTNKAISEHYEKKLAGEYKLRGTQDDDATYALQDVSLPAVFMPSKGRDLTIYNPRASKYFHPTGAGGLRLTQPPSMVQLPPLPKNKVNVVNLFNISNNFRNGGTNEWLLHHYMQQEQQQQEVEQAQKTEQEREHTTYPSTPAEPYTNGVHPPDTMGRDSTPILVSAGGSPMKEAILE